MTEDIIKQIREALKAATPGPWEAVSESDPRGQPAPYYRSLIAQVELSPDRHLAVVQAEGRSVSKDQWEPNAQLIALLRNNAEELLDAAERDQAGDGEDAWMHLAQAMTELKRYKRALEEALKLLAERACSDHGCWFPRTGGMGTNGGCQHDKMDKHELRRDYRALVRSIRQLLEAEKGDE